MSQERNRLLMELEHAMRSVNREIINPEIDALTIDGLRPVLRTVAHARARYLKALFALGVSESAENSRPTDEQFKDLAQLRYEYEELVNGAMALETALQRGYLEVIGSTR